MSIKKLLTIILASVIPLSILASCSDGNGGQTDSDAPKKETETTEKGLSDISAGELIYFLNPNISYQSSIGCMEYIFNNVDSKDDFVSKFTDEDFSVLDINTVDGAKFETIMLNKKDELVTLYWIESESKMRVLCETIDEKLLSVLQPNPVTDSGALTFAQVGIERADETDNPLNGMCYIIKLASGKAIVIDGGMANEPCADNIYNTLGKLDIAKNADGKYMIEAWFFSHGHSDHIGVMTHFAPKYGDKVSVDYFLYNLPVNSGVSTLTKDERPFHELCMATFPESVFVIPHAGIKYYFGNAVIDMLYVPDLVWSPDTPITHYNSTSIIFKLQGGGASFYCFGDGGDPAALALCNHYDSSAFKSDILQITHHGLGTGGGSDVHAWEYVKKVYDAIEATYAVLPMHARYLDGYERNGRFGVLIDWCNAGYHASYYMNESDNHGRPYINQIYYNNFCNSVREGTNTKDTLYGYDGINKIVNENGLITYMGGNEYKPMITIFTFENDKVTLVENQELYTWLAN